jgi:hypothetical protein
VRDIDNEVVILHEDTSLKGHFGIAQWKLRDFSKYK